MSVNHLGLKVKIVSVNHLGKELLTSAGIDLLNYCIYYSMYCLYTVLADFGLNQLHRYRKHNYNLLLISKEESVGIILL